MHTDPPRLLLVAHGTASTAGAATTRTIAAAVRAARPAPAVDLCFLDVIGPTLAESLDDRPTVVVPLLLSTGYHVQSDIPAAVADHPATRVAGHLGPHPLVVDALMERTLVDPGAVVDATVLVAAGSSRSGAAAEVAAAAEQVQRRMVALNAAHRTTVATMADDLDAVFAAQPGQLQVAVYLLAEGAFVMRVEQAARDRGLTRVPPPIGAHPGVVELVWKRYDEAAGTR